MIIKNGKRLGADIRIRVVRPHIFMNIIKLTVTYFVLPYVYTLHIYTRGHKLHTGKKVSLEPGIIHRAKQRGCGSVNRVKQMLKPFALRHHRIKIVKAYGPAAGIRHASPKPAYGSC